MNLDYDEEIGLCGFGVGNGRTTFTAKYDWNLREIRVQVLDPPKSVGVVIRGGIAQDRPYYEAEELGRRVGEAVKKMWGLQSEFDKKCALIQ